jgi:hypothetical protein
LSYQICKINKFPTHNSTNKTSTVKITKEFMLPSKSNKETETQEKKVGGALHPSDLSRKCSLELVESIKAGYHHHCEERSSRS